MKPQIPLNQCALYKCGSKRRLAEILLVRREELTSRRDWISYSVFEEPKANGGTRTIHAPAPKLKEAQARIQKLLSRVEKPEWVFSGTKGKCHVDNARYHEGVRSMVTSDIASFYDSCARESVYRFFADKMRAAPDVAEILADLTTYTDEAGRSCIPTGSPCSQLVAYFAYEDMFQELHEVAAQYGCRLSLYVDDVAMSSKGAIADPRSLEKRLAKVLGAYGHRLKWSKTKYRGSAQSKVVTGVALSAGNGELRVPNHLGEKVIKGMRSVKGGDAELAPSVLGRIGAARQIVPDVFPEAERVILRSTSD